MTFVHFVMREVGAAVRLRREAVYRQVKAGITRPARA